MHPLAHEFNSYSDFESNLLSQLSDGSIIGFFLDNRTGELRKSGLITNADAVMPLHRLLGDRATLYYPDPRRFKRHEYLDAVGDFGQKLLGLDNVRYEVEPPALLLMTYGEERFERTEIMSLDSRRMCLWYSEVSNFLEDYLGNHPKDQPRRQEWSSMIKSGAGTIGLGTFSECAGNLLSNLIPI